ncbi:hypothetical protein HOV93_38840 [Planctomycetes bacterium FF15]|uniref:Mutator family transposase n=1 Tax=Bremerella alba TaxID=980252 RepID=A0A7V9A8R0_9BACT|nr:hypothetical protein [Bremerella alba]
MYNKLRAVIRIPLTFEEAVFSRRTHELSVSLDAALECPKNLAHRCERSVCRSIPAVHAQEDLAGAKEKAELVTEKLTTLRRGAAAKCFREDVSETLAYMAFPREHWTRLRSNNMLERIMKEIRRRTRVVGAFPDVGPGCVTSHAPSEARDVTWTWTGSTNRRRREKL